MDLDQFRASLVKAFAGVRRPWGDSVTGSGCPEGQFHDDYFRNKPWCGHPVDALREHASALSFFTGPALHYYLPAFVLAVLEDRKAADIIYDDLIGTFSRPADSDDQGIVQRLSPAQRAVMVEYFRHRLEAEGDYSGGMIARAIAALTEQPARNPDPRGDQPPRPQHRKRRRGRPPRPWRPDEDHGSSST